MPSFMFAPWAPLLFGLLVGIAAFLIRHFALKRPPSVNYFQVFMDSGVAYVLTLLIANHYVFNVAYADALRDNFGAEAVAVAFLYASYHMTAEILHHIVRKE